MGRTPSLAAIQTLNPLGKKSLSNFQCFPVIAFTGAPGSFPVQDENRVLQKYLVWTEKIANQAKTFIKNKLPAGAYIGIHLRNGIDWVCKLN